MQIINRKQMVKPSGLTKNYTGTSGITLLTKPIFNLRFYIRENSPIIIKNI